MILLRSLNRIYHPYWDWEEVGHNMWGSVKDRNKYLQWAIDFTGDAERYGSYMLRVTKEWPLSCEHNLTDAFQNRKAWIGHAACALANRCPEDIVRQAWSRLSRDQQKAANCKAEEAIKEWECQNEVSVKPSMTLL